MLNRLSSSLLFLTFNVFAQEEVINVSVETDTYKYAQEILQGQPAIEVTNYACQNSQRDVVEFILVQKALALGGLQLKFSFTTGNYDARNIKLLRSGLLLISFDSMWHSHVSQFADELYISEPVIEKGEYMAGIYTSKENHAKITVKALSDLQKLTVVSNKNWPVDWATLQQIAPKSLMHEEEWLSMAKIVSKGWVDVMLAPFTRNYPFNYQGKGYFIKAIDGAKVALNDSRHFAISKKHPNGKETFIALQKGLAILRQRGEIARAYQQSGFLNKQVQHWNIINKSKLIE